MDRIDRIDPRDRKYIAKSPSPGFSQARAKAIIEQVITDYEAEIVKRDKAWKDKADDRIDMAVSYLKRRAGGLEKRVEDYLGPSNLKKAWGERFTEKLQIASVLYRKKSQASKTLL